MIILSILSGVRGKQESQCWRVYKDGSADCVRDGVLIAKIRPLSGFWWGSVSPDLGNILGCVFDVVGVSPDFVDRERAVQWVMSRIGPCEGMRP